VIDGVKWNITYRPKEKKSVTEWYKNQGRFKHLFSPENQGLLKELQQHVDDDWNILIKKTECFGIDKPAPQEVKS